MNNIICIIPARLASTRFPNKPMKNILGLPMIGHIGHRCRIENVFSDIVVTSCDQEILDFSKKIGFNTILTSFKHERATDRVQEALAIWEKEKGKKYDYVVMVQGDEPMVTPSMLKSIVATLEQGQSKVVNLVAALHDNQEWMSINTVKVVMGQKNNALYFSRAPIPNSSKTGAQSKRFKQTGLIGFEKAFVDTYSSLPPTPLEDLESCDMLRVLEHGFSISCCETQEKLYPVDVPEDLVKVESLLRHCPLTARYLK